jgi:Tol biopolymer transport system component
MKLLTDDEGTDKLPSWSPDGSKIAFNSERFDASKDDYADGEDIFTVNAKGGSIEFLTENDATNTNPRWSPNGSKIAFVSNNNSDNDVEIYEMDANGSNSTRLTNNSSSYDDHPSWSPDGTKIIFEGENGLYTVPSGGGGTAQKISNSDDFETPFWELVK